MNEIITKRDPRRDVENSWSSSDEVTDILSSPASLSQTIATLRLQSRGFLDFDRFIDVMGNGERQSPSEREANIDRVALKLSKVMKGLA